MSTFLTWPQLFKRWTKGGYSAIQWIDLYPVDSATGFPNTYPLDRDLSDG